MVVVIVACYDLFHGWAQERVHPVIMYARHLPQQHCTRRARLLGELASTREDRLNVCSSSLQRSNLREIDTKVSWQESLVLCPEATQVEAVPDLNVFASGSSLTHQDLRADRLEHAEEADTRSLVRRAPPFGVPRKLEPVAELDCLTLVAQLLLRGLQLREELAGHGGFHATCSRLRPRVLFDDLDVEGGLLENGGRHVAFSLRGVCTVKYPRSSPENTSFTEVWARDKTPR